MRMTLVTIYLSCVYQKQTETKTPFHRHRHTKTRIHALHTHTHTGLMVDGVNVYCGPLQPSEVACV